MKNTVNDLRMIYTFFHASLASTSTLTVHCMGSFLLVRPVDKRQKQLEVRFYSSWYIMRTGVGTLAREIRLAMTSMVKPSFTCYSLLWFWPSNFCCLD